MAAAAPSSAITADVRDVKAPGSVKDEDGDVYGVVLPNDKPKTLADIPPVDAAGVAPLMGQKYVPPHKRKGFQPLPPIPIELAPTKTTSTTTSDSSTGAARAHWETVRQPIFADRLGENQYTTLANFSRVATGRASGLGDVSRFETTFRAFRGKPCAARQTSHHVLSTDQSMMFKVIQTPTDGYGFAPVVATDVRGKTISQLIGAPRRVVSACTYDAIAAIQAAAAMETSRVPFEVLLPPTPVAADAAAAAAAAVDSKTGGGTPLVPLAQSMCREAPEIIDKNIATWAKDTKVDAAEWFRGTKKVSAVPHPKGALSLNDALHQHLAAAAIQMNNNTLLLDAPDWRSPTKSFYPGHETSYRDALEHPTVLATCNAVVLTNRPYWPQTLGTKALAGVLRNWDLYVQRGSISRADEAEHQDDFDAYQALIKAYDAVLDAPKDDAAMLALMSAAKTMHTARHEQVEDKIKSAASHLEQTPAERARHIFEIGAQARDYVVCKYFFVFVRRATVASETVARVLAF